MDIFKSNVAVGITAALAATILAPVLVPIITVAGRPLAKSLIKGGVILYEKGRETVAGAGETMEDLIAEVRSEMERQPGSVGAPSEQTASAAPQAESRGDERGMETEAGISPRQTGNGAQVQ